MSEPQPSGKTQGRLGLWDTISIIVGIIIGAGIYETPKIIFGMTSGPLLALAVWIVAGLLAFVGALCYAELATTYPRSGGDYVYQTRAYGPLIGYLFGWTQLAVIQTGSIGLMAYVFGDYATRLYPLGDMSSDFSAVVRQHSSVIYAATAIIGITAINLLGVVLGKTTQNILTLVKVLGLGLILVAGFGFGQGALAEEARSEWDTLTTTGLPSLAALGLPFVLVFITYGGWNDAAFVASEVRDRRRNIPLSLLVGTLLVMVIYVLVNAAYLVALGYKGASNSNQIAADVLRLLPGQFGTYGEKLMAVLVMISALGAVNGLIFTSSRIYATLGEDYSLFAALSVWNKRSGVPVWSLLISLVISLLLIVLVGTKAGQDLLNQGFARLTLPEVDWKKERPFESLLRCTAPVFWAFFLLTAMALFVLRRNDRHIARPFSVPFYPITPLIFCITCGYMLHSGIGYAGQLGLVGGALVLAGVPLYVFSRRKNTEAKQPDALDTFFEQES